MAMSMVLALATVMFLRVGSAKAGDQPVSPVMQAVDEQGSPAEPEPAQEVQTPQVQEPQLQQEPAAEQDQPAAEQPAPQPESKY